MVHNSSVMLVLWQYTFNLAGWQEMRNSLKSKYLTWTCKKARHPTWFTNIIGISKLYNMFYVQVVRLDFLHVRVKSFDFREIIITSFNMGVMILKQMRLERGYWRKLKKREGSCWAWRLDVHAKNWSSICFTHLKKYKG